MNRAKLSEPAWREAIAKASARLEAAGVASAARDARELAEYALGVAAGSGEGRRGSGAEAGVPAGPDAAAKALARLEAAGVESPEHAGERADRALGPVPVALDAEDSGPGRQTLFLFEACVARRAAREPLQHITGTMPFRFLELACRPGVFVTRPETEWMADVAIAEARRLLDAAGAAGRDAPVVVDLCTGSGALALALATEVPGCRVLGVELSRAAYAVACENNERYGKPAEFVRGDALAAPGPLAELEGKVDVVVSNPPYVPAADPVAAEAESDPALALFGGGADGLAFPRALVEAAAGLLKPGGLLVMEHAPSQARALREAALASGFAEASTGRDAAGRDRWLRARLEGAPGLEKPVSRTPERFRMPEKGQAGAALGTVPNPAPACPQCDTQPSDLRKQSVREYERRAESAPSRFGHPFGTASCAGRGRRPGGRSLLVSAGEPHEYPAAIAAACAAIDRGELVVLPTDTVYGLGADAFSKPAVERLLAAKGRGRDKPAPVLVASVGDAEALARVDARARALMDAFWPGGLTLVLPAREGLGWDLGETNGTVALRMPDHPCALALLEAAGPLAVSSANLAGRPAARTSAQAEAMLGEKVACYLDAGEVPGGVPSTIVALDANADGQEARIVRIGAVGDTEVRKVVSTVV